MRNLNIEVNTNKQILSSETRIYKTESFFYQTKKLSKIDTFILNIAEGLLSVTDEIASEELAAILEKLGKTSSKFGTPYLAVVQNGEKTGEQPGYIEKEELIEFFKKNGLVEE